MMGTKKGIEGTALIPILGEGELCWRPAPGLKGAATGESREDRTANHTLKNSSRVLQVTKLGSEKLGKLPQVPES